MQKSGDYMPDTNVILRYLLKDNQEQFRRAEEFFEDVRTGRKKALILESVLVECVYVLMKFYQVPKNETVEILSGLLHYKGVVNRDKDELISALRLFAENKVDVVDCVLLAKAGHDGTQIFSFDKDLNMLAETPR